MTSVIIVGAGVVGLFCATRLARAGMRVIVLEGQQEDFTPYAPTASLAAAGMLSPIGEGGSSAHTGFEALCLESFDVWKRVRLGASWEDGVRFEGAAMVGAGAVGADTLLAKARELGRAASTMSSGQWRRHTGIDARVEHAVFVEDEGVADPLRVLSGLVMEARKLGAEVRYGIDVDAVEKNKLTQSDGKTLEADYVLLAPGVWATERLQAAAPALKQVTPAKGQLVPVTLERPLGASVHASDFYLAPRLNDVVLGASMEAGKFDRAADATQAEALLAAAERLLPGAVRVQGRGWAGIRPMSPDSAPLIGKSGDFLVACGHSRNGWLLAPITAEIIAAMILGEPLSPLWTSFSPDRFEKTQ